MLPRFNSSTYWQYLHQPLALRRFTILTLAMLNQLVSVCTAAFGLWLISVKHRRLSISGTFSRSCISLWPTFLNSDVPPPADIVGHNPWITSKSLGGKSPHCPSVYSAELLCLCVIMCWSTVEQHEVGASCQMGSFNLLMNAPEPSLTDFYVKAGLLPELFYSAVTPPFTVKRRKLISLRISNVTMMSVIMHHSRSFNRGL